MADATVVVVLATDGSGVAPGFVVVVVVPVVLGTTAPAVVVATAPADVDGPASSDEQAPAAMRSVVNKARYLRVMIPFRRRKPTL